MKRKSQSLQFGNIKKIVVVYKARVALGARNGPGKHLNVGYEFDEHQERP